MRIESLVCYVHNDVGAIVFMAGTSSAEAKDTTEEANAQIDQILLKHGPLLKPSFFYNKARVLHDVHTESSLAEEDPILILLGVLSSGTPEVDIARVRIFRYA